MSSKVELRRVAKGKRPQYFEDLATDNLLSMVLALSQELSVAIDRIDTLEQILAEDDTISLDRLQNFEPPENVQQRRSDERDLMLRKMFRATESQHRNRTSGKGDGVNEDTL